MPSTKYGIAHERFVQGAVGPIIHSNCSRADEKRRHQEFNKVFIDPVAERLQQRAVSAVLNGTALLTSTEVGTRVEPKAANKDALASRLLKEGRVFAIEHGGHNKFPSYAFDSQGNPIPAMHEVLGILAGYTPFRIASWFESTSSQLGGRRPREVLATDPEAVIAAARAHLTGPVHG